MSRKSKRRAHAKRRQKVRETAPQEPQDSSWGAAVLSFFKEFFCNFSGPGHLYYDENLTDAGKQKKSLLWGVVMLLLAAAIALLPFKAWHMVDPDILAAKILIVAVCECFAIFMGGCGIANLKDALTKHPDD